MISQAGADIFMILEEATSSEEALRILDKHFKKPTRGIYEWHQLLSSAQKTGVDFGLCQGAESFDPKERM